MVTRFTQIRLLANRKFVFEPMAYLEMVKWAKVCWLCDETSEGDNWRLPRENLAQWRAGNGQGWRIVLCPHHMRSEGLLW